MPLSQNGKKKWAKTFLFVPTGFALCRICSRAFEVAKRPCGCRRDVCSIDCMTEYEHRRRYGVLEKKARTPKRLDRQVPCAGCGVPTRSTLDPPRCSECQWGRGRHPMTRGTASDERIAELSARLAAKLPLTTERGYS